MIRPSKPIIFGICIKIQIRLTLINHAYIAEEANGRDGIRLVAFNYLMSFYTS